MAVQFTAKMQPLVSLMKENVELGRPMHSKTLSAKAASEVQPGSCICPSSLTSRSLEGAHE